MILAKGLILQEFSDVSFGYFDGRRASTDSITSTAIVGSCSNRGKTKLICVYAFILGIRENFMWQSHQHQKPTLCL